MKIYDYSQEDEFNYQLTRWVGKYKTLKFAVDQLEKYNAPYRIKRYGKKIAVFTEGKDIKRGERSPSKPRKDE